VSIRFRPAAVQELDELLSRIRNADPQAAVDVEQSVRLTLELLETNPLSCTRMTFRNPSLRGLRYATVRYYPQFVILYLPTVDGVEVLRVVRGRRNLRNVVAND
jgi:plasmid stabilization system protein ParE